MFKKTCWFDGYGFWGVFKSLEQLHYRYVAPRHNTDRELMCEGRRKDGKKLGNNGRGTMKEGEQKT